MAMTLPIALPSTPSSGNSPSADQSDRPHTPMSPTTASPAQQVQAQQQASSTQSTPAQQQGQLQGSQSALPATSAANAAQMKRKPSRRANTAERRATHNAVERQRRETLNGRFLDLAALLPNLSQIRRPSKSSIVNSSIAHIHASRRHRILAARELRLIKLEADALRRELNEWRDRAGIPRIEEPIRGEGFSVVLSGELEAINAVLDEDGDDEDPYEDQDGDYLGQAPPMMPNIQEEIEHDPHHGRHPMMKQGIPQNTDPFQHGLPPPVPAVAGHQGSGIPLTHPLSRSGHSAMVSSPTFDSPASMAGLYDHPGQYASATYIQPSGGPGAWNMFNQQQQQQQMMQAQRSLFTPPGSSHGPPSAPSAANGNGNNPSGSPPGSAGGPNAHPFSNHDFFASIQRQQMIQQQHAQHGNNGANNSHGYTGSERDDTSSVGSLPRGGSGGGPRERSGSVLSAGSGGGSGYGGSPPHHPHHHSHGGHGGASPVGGYELASTQGGPGGPAGPAGDHYAAARRWGREAVDLGGQGGGAGMHHPGHPHGHHGVSHHAAAAASIGHHPMGANILPSPISAGGHGGGGGGFAMIM